ncbi:hypothetical protein B0J12DRAFT_224889 [Macrophomina phaseolina]|uniref:Uncharacterized protein n=1 Tax=Macrophomina phaseolina TaxID=35725 RepID=A0ABQ8GPF6_9PEZI|nr:hypothetical protein B0J12DRAFT_224889 [Macrophomina phaseolina]
MLLLRRRLSRSLIDTPVRRCDLVRVGAILGLALPFSCQSTRSRFWNANPARARPSLALLPTVSHTVTVLALHTSLTHLHFCAARPHHNDPCRRAACAVFSGQATPGRYPAAPSASTRCTAVCRRISVTNITAASVLRVDCQCLIEFVVASAWRCAARVAKSAFLEEKSIPSQGDRLFGPGARYQQPRVRSGNPHHGSYSDHAQWLQGDGPTAAIRYLEIKHMPTRRGSTAILRDFTKICSTFRLRR